MTLALHQAVGTGHAFSLYTQAATPPPSKVLVPSIPTPLIRTTLDGDPFIYSPVYSEAAEYSSSTDLNYTVSTSTQVTTDCQ